MRILVVEDDSALRLGLKRTLLAEGWQVDVVEDGEQAISATSVDTYDFAVLDLNLPKQDGLFVLQSWRSNKMNHPILILSARDELTDRLMGLNGGADDYLVKPFEPSELVARIRAIVRRKTGNIATQIELGGLKFNVDTRELLYLGSRIPLSPRESALMELLMSSGGHPVPKNRIVSTMSSWESDFSPNAVEIYILKLRKKLMDTGVSIVTVRGVGYVMEKTL